MYSYLRTPKTPVVKAKTILTFVISLTALSIIDIIFNTLALPKGTYFVLAWLLFVAAFVYSSFQLVKHISFESNYFKYLFYIFMGYGMITVLRGLSFSTTELTSFLRTPYIFYPFFLPFFAFFGKQLTSFRILLNYLFYLGIVYIILILLLPEMLLSPGSSEILAYSLVLGPGFIFMNSYLFSKIKVNISFIFILIATLSFVYLARRAGLFIMLGFIASGYALAVLTKQKNLLFKLFPWLVVVGVIVFFQFDNLYDSLLDAINKRLYEDTRSTITDMFYMDIDNHMALGKGMNATYYCPIGGGLSEDGVDYDITYYRDVIENGYLQLMLSGGILHVLLFLSIMIPASFNGIFRSSNQFTKSCGAMILLWMVFMIGSGLPTLSIGYILVWMCVGVCYRKSIRVKTDAEIKEAFSFPKNPPRKEKQQTKFQEKRARIANQ